MNDLPTNGHQEWSINCGEGNRNFSYVYSNATRICIFNEKCFWDGIEDKAGLRLKRRGNGYKFAKNLHNFD